MKKQIEVKLWVRILILPISYFIMIIKILVFIPAYVIAQINTTENNIKI